MGSVNEARYTFWHTIVDLEKASGLPKAEWCRKNCISIRTFNHYEGIFKRQEVREALHYKEEEDKQYSEVENTINELNGVEEIFTKDFVDASTDSTNKKKHRELSGCKSVESKNTVEEMGSTGKSRYFEVPKPGRAEPVSSIMESKIAAREGIKSELPSKVSSSTDRQGKLERSGNLAGTIREKDENMSCSFGAVPTDAITIEANGFRVVVGNGIGGADLEKILKAVQDNA